MVDNDDVQQALMVYVQTCETELFQDDDEPPREEDQGRLVSQSEFADFVWDYCRTNSQFAGSACAADSATMVEDETQPSSSSSSFDALPLQAKLAFLPKEVNDSSAGCSKDAPLLDQLNCLVFDISRSNNPSEQDEGQDEIYLKASERIDILCSNTTYALLLESDLLQSPQPVTPTNGGDVVSPSTDAPAPGNASSSSLLHQQHSGLTPGAIAAIVLTALFVPIFLLAIYCWRRKKQYHQENSNNLLQLFTKFTALTFDDEPGDGDHHHGHDEENPSLSDDQSVSSENSRAFSPVSAAESSNTDGTEEREKSSIACWIHNLSPRCSEATQRSFRQPQRPSKKKSTATAASNGSVRSHGNSSKGSSRRSRGGNSQDKQSKCLSSTFDYPTELHESVVSPGNSLWFQTSSAVPPACITEHISHDNPVLQRKRFNHNNTKTRPAVAFDEQHELSTPKDIEVSMLSNREVINSKVVTKHDKERRVYPPTMLDVASRPTSTKPKSRYSPTTTTNSAK